jgi:pimeloyl-ACP methyl ester carboxylesterase
VNRTSLPFPLLPGASAWLSGGTWLDFAGCRLFVTEAGQGPPVLALHAFPTASYDYCRLAPLLASRFRLIFSDYPGFGFSDKPRHYPYSLFTYAAAVQRVAAHFGLTETAVLAHDIGDSVALELLRQGRPRVKSLVLLNGSIISVPFPDFRMRLAQRLLLNPATGAVIVHLRLFNRRRFAHMLQSIFAMDLTPAEIDAFWSLLRYNAGHTLYHRLMRYMLERWQHQAMWLEALQAHPAPLTLVWGQADPVAPPAVAEQIVTMRGNVRYVPLPGVGHYPHWEAPAAVAAEVTQALA